MQNNFIQVKGDQVIIDINDLMTLALVAAVVIVALIVVTVVLKKRKKNFIKTLPTNLKEDA